MSCLELHSISSIQTYTSQLFDFHRRIEKASHDDCKLATQAELKLKFELLKFNNINLYVLHD